ncbi:MAG TPA: carbohydrate-binding protein [Lachnospiraceae bacterium]|nr:carbohydrate-binding protein [Lachnospiraceae bacterium]
MTPQSSYSSNGVSASELTGNSIKLTYNGLLPQSGASQVYAFVGYGSNYNWESVENYPMDKTMGTTFETNIPVKKTGNLNICFKDSANNWDNNSGMNYTFTSSIDIRKGSL